MNVPRNPQNPAAADSVGGAGAGQLGRLSPISGDSPVFGRVAVVDIGSNSVRLVVYDAPARLPVPIFNEKSDCGLARGLEQTGRLNPEGVDRARAALSRFVNLARSMGVERLELVATAAVRDAADGLHFVEEVENTFDLPVQVPSGAEEARLSALGLLIGVPKADGLLGDLGGGSLDLVALDEGHFGANATLPLGHIRMVDFAGDDMKAAAKHADRLFKSQPWLKDIKGRTLYAVGGSWRALARIFIEQTGYPIHVIDGFTMSSDDLSGLTKLIAGQSQESLQSMASVSRKRAGTLAMAAMVMDRLLKRTKPREIVFSGFGMREGQMIKSLPPEVRSQDPLIAGCETLAERTGRFSLGGMEMQAWMAPLFADESERHRRLRYVSGLLSDIGWTEHPDYRAKHAFYRVLRLPYAGLTHADRVFLATAVFVRYNGDPKHRFVAKVLPLASEEDSRVAERVGLALRLAHTVSGSSPGLLAKTRLRIDGENLILELPEVQREVFMGDAVGRRLKTLGKAFGLDGWVA